MRYAALVLLGLVVLALGAAGFATATRLGVYRGGTSTAGDALDPESIGRGGGTVATPPPGLCPPLPEAGASGGSDLVLTGTCAFHHSGQAYCRHVEDDFYVFVRRLLQGGRTLDLYVNVEFYRGPGPYDSVQLMLIAQDGTTLYQWTNFHARATVESGEAALRLPEVRLATEPGMSGGGVVTASGLIRCGAAAPSG